MEPSDSAEERATHGRPAASFTVSFFPAAARQRSLARMTAQPLRAGRERHGELAERIEVEKDEDRGELFLRKAAFRLEVSTVTKNGTRMLRRTRCRRMERGAARSDAVAREQQKSRRAAARQTQTRAPRDQTHQPQETRDAAQTRRQAEQRPASSRIRAEGHEELRRSRGTIDRRAASRCGQISAIA